MDYRAAFKGEYIKAVELEMGREVTMRIAAWRIVKLENEKGVSDRLTLWFDATERGMVVNRTNAECIAAMFGAEMDGWIGKRITIYRDPTVRLGKETVDGLRLRGSPDIAAPVNATIKMPRKKAQTITLRPTGRQQPADREPERVSVASDGHQLGD